MGCPYEGEVDVQKVVDITKRLFDLGCYEVKLLYYIRFLWEIQLELAPRKKPKI
jgi:hypothetical protein